MTEHSDEERRHSPRRWVMMRVLLEDQHNIQFGQTVNISDTGMLIEKVPEFEFSLDQQLDVVIQGVLSDDEQEANARAMMVVRITDEHVALTFL